MQKRKRQENKSIQKKYIDGNNHYRKREKRTKQSNGNNTRRQKQGKFKDHKDTPTKIRVENI